MICMVPNCPHGICGQNGIPKFPQIGCELPAKIGKRKRVEKFAVAHWIIRLFSLLFLYK